MKILFILITLMINEPEGFTQASLEHKKKIKKKAGSAGFLHSELQFFSKRKGLTHHFRCSWILPDLFVAEDLKLEVDQINFFGAELVGDVQSSKASRPLQNFPSMKLSPSDVGAKSLVVLDFLLRSI